MNVLLGFPRVPVVDDERQILDLFLRVLRDRYTVTRAVSGNQTLFVGGAAHALDVSNKALVAATLAFFLGGTRAASGFFVAGKVARFLAWNRALSATEISTLSAYLLGKYGA